MKARLAHLWDTFHSSFWFVPTNLSLALAVLAAVVIRIDVAVDDRLVRQAPWLAMSPASARATLSAIAGAMVTSTSLVFSITIVAVSIAASQFGSRLIRNFRNNRVTHWTLGAFVSTSLYSLLLLVAVREGEGTQFVPYLAVYMSLFCALGCLGLLIYFIHNTAVSVQAPNIVQASASDLDAAIDRLFPSKLGDAVAGEKQEGVARERYEQLGDDCDVVYSIREGYVQAIDAETLMAIASERDIVIELLARPGTFLTKNLPLAKIWAKEPIADEAAKKISNTYITGKVRTPRQDVKYAVNELVEVALRALSPGVNDPFTAMTCIDRLGASVGRLAERQIPSAFRRDENDELRVIARPVTFSDLLNAAFNQIRQNARSNVSVIIRLLTALEAIAVQVRHEEDRKAVLLQAEMIRRGGEEAVDEANDRQPIQRQFERVKQVLEHRLDKDESVKDEGEVQEDKQPPTDKSLHPSPD